MKINALKITDTEEIKKVENYLREEKIGLDCLTSFLDLQSEADSNEINECVYIVKDDKVKNTCFYNGTKDNKLVEATIINLKQKEFVKEATEYAFNYLDCETITIFSNEQEDKILSDLGFESIGDYNGVNTYIKDNINLVQQERVR